MKKLCESFNEITIKRGEKFSIELMENASTGYRWQFRIVSGKAQKLDDQYDAQNATAVGGVGKRTMTYKAFGKKDIVIKADYKRSWQKESAGELTLKVKIA